MENGEWITGHPRLNSAAPFFRRRLQQPDFRRSSLLPLREARIHTSRRKRRGRATWGTGRPQDSPCGIDAARTGAVQGGQSP